MARKTRSCPNCGGSEISNVLAPWQERMCVTCGAILNRDWDALFYFAAIGIIGLLTITGAWYILDL